MRGPEGGGQGALLWGYPVSWLRLRERGNMHDPETVSVCDVVVNCKVRGGNVEEKKPLPIRVELRDVTLVLPRWEAAHATGGGQWGAELRDDHYGEGPPSRGLLTGWGRRSGISTPETPSIVVKRARRNVVRKGKPRVPESNL